MGSGRIIVVDDDKNLIELVKMRLESAGYDVTAAVQEDEALSAVKTHSFDICLLDLMLRDRDGIALMGEIHAVAPDIPVIILTAHGSIESAVEAMRKGAYSYLTKPFEPQDLLLQIDRALEHRRLNSEIKRLKELLEEKYDFANIIARSAKMRSVLDIVTRIATLDSIQIASCFTGAAVLSRRQRRSSGGGRPGDCGYQQRFGRASEKGTLPRRFVLSNSRDPHLRAAFERTQRGHRPAGRELSE